MSLHIKEFIANILIVVFNLYSKEFQISENKSQAKNENLEIMHPYDMYIYIN